jgi:citrate synthase
MQSCGASPILLTKYELIHEDMKFHFEGFPPNAHPMAILSSMINAAGCYYPELLAPQEAQDFGKKTAFIISQVRTRRMRLPQVTRATDYLSQTAKYILGQLFAHDVLRA